MVRRPFLYVYERSLFLSRQASAATHVDACKGGWNKALFPQITTGLPGLISYDHVNPLHKGKEYISFKDILLIRNVKKLTGKGWKEEISSM